MSIKEMIGWGVLAVLLFWAVGAYNRLVRLRSRIDEAFAQLDVPLKRRYELIANLVETARQHVEHERETLEAVLAARDQASVAADHARARPTRAAALGALTVAEQALGNSLERLTAMAENYPELKADETLSRLGEELSGTEGRIAFARQAFNGAVQDYNAAAQQFPTRLLSRVFGFRRAGLLKVADEEAGRAAARMPF
ncbi:LemA family protein [Caldimonas tepidiphila]|uniref:LemA family protein n=1 Tax=Caldimonas tepidiphila TaxID=2315841 RepID=UPI000E5A19AC|nr:LemA family protein [Caldimonas tepidiphila]